MATRLMTGLRTPEPMLRRGMASQSDSQAGRTPLLVLVEQTVQTLDYLTIRLYGYFELGSGKKNASGVVKKLLSPFSVGAVSNG
jgi:hypothetical protein